MYTRPSKNFFFPLLKKELAKTGDGIGVDVGSAGMKNRGMFLTDIYIGIDINQELLQKGLEKENSANTFGLVADITKLNSLPSNFADVVASSNTLYCLPEEKIPEAIKSLSRITRNGGSLLYQILKGKDTQFEKTIQELAKQFQTVKVIYYKNFINNLYEKFFERDGNLGSHPLAGSKPFLFLSYLLSRLEYLTCKMPLLNKEVFIICRNKVENNKTAEHFDITKFNEVSNRLYRLI
ncbi:MAG: methyltransferase domain-containing protein [Candidatus Paceibacterota bacterium]|jgi:hypothetical protein